MSHYEQRLQRDLDQLHLKVERLGAMSESAVRDAVKALLQFDLDLANQTVIGDQAINRGSQQIDRLCHSFVATHLPSAGNLRYVSSVLRITHILERIGDYAETVARTVLHLTGSPPDILVRDLESLSEHALRVLHQAMKSFKKRNVELAQGTLELANQFTKTVDQSYEDMADVGKKAAMPVPDMLALLACFNRTQRIIHQSKNICEETIFIVRGKKKPKKRFDFLFVDATNSGASQLAERHANKAYPDAGTFRSAGWRPAGAMDQVYLDFTAGNGLDLQGLKPKGIDELDEEITEFDFIFDLDGEAQKQLPSLAYHTIVLRWPLEDADSPEAVFKQVSTTLKDLMIRLFGDEDG